MPKVSEFKEKTKKKNQNPAGSVESGLTDSKIATEDTDAGEKNAGTKSTKARRRPGNIHHAQTMKDPGLSQPIKTESSMNPEQIQTHEDISASVHEASPKAEHQEFEKLDFYGADLLKEHVPQLHRSIEIIAQDWKNDGRFEGLPVGHPLLQALASVGLQRAKKVEKKLEERGVFMMARMGADMVKMKLNELRGKKDGNE